MISAKVIADSQNEFGNRLTTMVVTFPRIILAEFNTHRMFSRNSASSRAIPFEKMVEVVQTNPFIPIAWQKDHKGMQGTMYHEDLSASFTRAAWENAITYAVQQAKALASCDVTKQLCNRLLEPFMWHTCIVTATEWENFFALRCPKYEVDIVDQQQLVADVGIFRSRKDARKRMTYFNELTDLEWLKLNKGQAEIHMMALAEAMWDAYNESESKQLKAGEWHIPFVEDVDKEFAAFSFEHAIQGYGSDGEWHEDNLIAAIKVATARCARVSYTVVGEEGKTHDYQKDIELHDRLAASGHWSPFEHCAKAMEGYVPESLAEYPMSYTPTKGEHEGSEWSGNFRGFIQYRKMFKNENIV